MEFTLCYWFWSIITVIVLSFLFSYCYSSYYFSDFSLDFDYFDSFVVSFDHLLHDQNHRVSYLVALVSSDVYRLELEQQQQLVLYGSQQLAPVTGAFTSGASTRFRRC